MSFEDLTLYQSQKTQLATAQRKGEIVGAAATVVGAVDDPPPVTR